MSIKTIGVLGLGVFGYTVARELGENGYDVIAVDDTPDDIELIEPYVLKAVVGDFSNLELLQAIGFQNCDIVVVATGNHLESSVLAVLNCKKLGIDHIIAKAKDNDYKDILVAIGATQIVRSEKETGLRIARNMMRHNIREVFDLDDQYAVIEFTPPKKWIGKTLEELNLRREYAMNIVGIRGATDSKMNVNVLPDYTILHDDLMIAIGETEKFEHLDYTNQLS